MAVNLYANSIFEDNPTCLWALDDDLTTPTIVSLSSTIPTTQRYGVESTAFGNSRFPAYYMSDNTSLFVRNGGIPLVFGSSSVTSVLPNSGYPSIIFPGFGFLNDDGKAKSITFEAWLRITTSTHYPRRIVGPITGDNGLYVNGPFLTLKIDDNVKSHYIGEWDRPMLIQMVYSESSFGLILNGEQVISITFNYKDLALPTKTDNSGDDQDWIGIYAYTNVPMIQVDAVAIYPYQMSVEKAKLHYVKGQSVESPELRNSSNSDVPIIVDYHMSKYANNYQYPGTGRWQNGAVDNLSTESNRLSVPNYQLPQIFFKSPSGDSIANELRTVDGWYDLQETLSGQSMTTTLSNGDLLDDEVFFSINPTETVATTEDDGGPKTNTSVSMWSDGYLYFDKFNLLSGDSVEAVYGVFNVSSLPGTKQVLFRIDNDLGEYFEASITNNDISYSFVSISGSESFSSSDVVTAGTKFVAGFDIQSLVAESTGSQLAAFFGNRSSLKMYVGGTPEFNNTFTGKIYKIGFCNKNNLRKISDSFVDGLADNADATSVFGAHFASYTLIGVTTFGSFALDIAIAGSWEDYVPLSLLAKNVITSASGAAVTTEYRLNAIQHNIDYPNITNINNALVKSYVEIKDLGVSTVSSDQIDKTKVTLSGGMFASNVIDFSNGWENILYEIDNNTVIFPPPTSDTNVSGINLEDRGLSTLIEMYVPGIIRNPISIRSLELSAQAMNHSDTKTPIGTKFGKDVYSYIDSGTTSYSYPYHGTIYKSSTPYLYLTKFSGFRGGILGNVGPTGIEVPINKFSQESYEVNYIQMAIYTNENFLTENEGEYPIFIVKDKTKTIFVNYTSTTGLSATLLAKKTTFDGSAYTDAEFYVDGIKDGTMYPGQWHMIGVKFTPLLSFSNINTGYIRLPANQFTINNVSDYQVPAELIRGTQFYDTWGEYIDPALADADNNWNDLPATWENAYLDSTGSIGEVLNPLEIYNSYIKSNTVLADETNTKMTVSTSSYRVFLGNRWQPYTVIPL